MSVACATGIAAGEQIKLGERRIFDHTMFGKDHHVADIFVDTIGAAARFDCKKTHQPVPRDVAGDACRIEANPGCSNGPTVNVGGKDSDLKTLFQRLLLFDKQDS